eukprot:3258229-Pyramimonas_sp.AAC.1
MKIQKLDDEGKGGKDRGRSQDRGGGVKAEHRARTLRITSTTRIQQRRLPTPAEPEPAPTPQSDIGRESCAGQAGGAPGK